MSKKEPNSTNVNIMKFLIHFNRKKNKKNKKKIPKTHHLNNALHNQNVFDIFYDLKSEIKL